MNQEQLLKVLLGPVVSEKSNKVAEQHRQYTFKVMTSATKPQIKKAVEKLFNVAVTDVTVVNVKGKQKRFGQRLGRRKDWKKAYVRLGEGHDINFADFTG